MTTTHNTMNVQLYIHTSDKNAMCINCFESENDFNRPIVNLHWGAFIDNITIEFKIRMNVLISEDLDEVSFSF